VVVDLGETQVAIRHRGKLANGVIGAEPAVFEVVEQGANA
jgi:hypothetical protein